MLEKFQTVNMRGRRERRRRTAIAFALSLLLSGSVAAQPKEADQAASAADRSARPEIISNVRLFDGERVIPNATVVLDGERIAMVLDDDEAATLTADPLAIVDGRGQTLLPGLMDAHFHSSGEIGSLEDSLRFGITTVFDLYVPEEKLVALREVIGLSAPGSIADYFSAGQCANVPGGHGTRDPDADAIAAPADAAAWIDRRIEAGVDYIKIVIEPGFFPGRPIPTLDGPTVRALVESAHDRGLLVVAHVSRRSAAEMAIDSGVDILVHAWAGGLNGDMLDDLMRANIPVIPTIAVYDGLYDNKGTLSMVQDLRLRNYLPPRAIPILTDLIELPAHGKTSAELQALTGELYRGGVQLLVGSDAQNINTWPGATVHREMELLVESGMKPIDVLRAATSGTADAFRKVDRGRIAPGMLADLVLVVGDPTTDILATRNITAIWKRGRLVKRELPQ